MLYVFLMYLTASKYYSRKDRYNPLLLIIEDWTVLDHVIFPFALMVLHNIWFIFLLHEFIYALLLVDIAYLVLYKEIVEKLWCLLEYREFTQTNNTNIFKWKTFRVYLKFKTIWSYPFLEFIQ